MTEKERGQHPIVLANRENNLYFRGTDNRIFYLPKHWADEIRDQSGDVDFGQSVYCYFGNPDVLAFRDRSDNEYLTSDALGWHNLDFLDTLPQVAEAEARELDPDLFALIDAINSGEAH